MLSHLFWKQTPSGPVAATFGLWLLDLTDVSPGDNPLENRRPGVFESAKMPRKCPPSKLKADTAWC